MTFLNKIIYVFIVTYFEEKENFRTLIDEYGKFS